MIKGKIQSIQTLGTLDGPGIRYVVFMQGCPLRCSCCHNPDTWDFSGGTEWLASDILENLLRYKSYFGTEGGITVSGGEALAQSQFVFELFTLCKNEGIHTCLDTSGCILDDEAKKLLTVTDLVLLDIKFTNEQDYHKYVKGSYQKTLKFLDYLEDNKIDTWLRQVIIGGINDTPENIELLSDISKSHTCVKKTELLAFRKLCTTKYESLGIEFPFKNIPETTKEQIEKLTKYLNLTK